MRSVLIVTATALAGLWLYWKHLPVRVVLMPPSPVVTAPLRPVQQPMQPRRADDGPHYIF